MRQYMCLIYRGYDNIDHPLNCAWAETDRFVWQGNVTQTMTYEEDPEFVQYIGYIEGPPPFYLNGEPDENPYLHKDNGTAISDVKYASSKTNSSEKDTDWQAGIETSCELGFFRGELNAAFHHKHNEEVSTTFTQVWGLESTGRGSGLYLMVEPTYQRDHYLLKDQANNVIDSLYYFSIINVDQNIAEVSLKGGLVPSDPTTYMHRNINLAAYSNDPSHYFGNSPKVSFDWVPSNTSGALTQIKVEKKDATSKGWNGNIKIGFGNNNGKDGVETRIFDVGAAGEIEVMTTTSTSEENELEMNIYLDEPIETMTNQCTKLNVDMYWLKPNHSEGVDNWWLPEGAKDQNTWCVTYVVTKFILEPLPDGRINEENIAAESTEAPSPAPAVEEAMAAEETKSDNRLEELIQTKTSLLQSYPNPFSSITRIQYQIGDDSLQGNAPADATRLVVYDFNGREVATLVNGNQSAGSYEVEWDASNQPPGVYLYSLQNGNFREVKKLILVK
jgi:hypothetical protein